MLTNIPSKKRTSESLSSSPLGSRSRLAQNTSASSNFDSAVSDRISSVLFSLKKPVD